MIIEEWEATYRVQAVWSRKNNPTAEEIREKIATDMPARNLQVEETGGIIISYLTQILYFETHGLVSAIWAAESLIANVRRLVPDARAQINDKSLEDVARRLSIGVKDAVKKLKQTRNWFKDPRLAIIRRELEKTLAL